MQIPDPATLGDDTIEIAPDVSFRWHADGRVAEVGIHNNDRATIDAWAEVVETVELEHFPPDQPVLMLLDIAPIGLTPYARRRAQAITQKTKHLRGKTAVVMKSSVFTTFMRIFVENTLKKSSQSFERRLFKSTSQALAWLLAEPDAANDF